MKIAVVSMFVVGIISAIILVLVWLNSHPASPALRLAVVATLTPHPVQMHRQLPRQSNSAVNSFLKIFSRL
jgi:hypothetical protein